MSQAGTGAPLTRREAIARERAGSGRRPRRRRQRSAPDPHPRRGFGHRILASGVLLFVGVLVVGLSLPANALYDPGAAAEAQAPVASALSGAAQSLAVDGSGTAIATSTDSYATSSKAQLLAQRYSGGVGGAAAGAVRWPFPYRVGILSPFGPRGAVAGCPSCAPFHRGVDLAGGNGNPIFSIASGVVTQRTGGSWSYGTYAMIVSHVDGHEVRAVYEHMQAGSSPLAVGQQVEVGDFVGLVGATGEATAPHLHLELDIDGELVDPIPWLEAHAR